MKKINLIFILPLFILISCSSAKIERGENFLWEVKDNNNTVYVLGSIHAAKESIYPLNNVIEKAYAQSDYLVVEADINNVDPMFLIRRMYYQDDTKLEDVVPAEVFQEIKAVFEENNVPLMVYEKLKPWAAIIMLSQFQFLNEGYGGEFGIDMYFLNKAAEDNKEILELESATAQIEIFEKLDEVFGEEFIKYSIDQMEDTTDYINDFFEKWAAGDVEGFEKIYKSAMVDFENQEKFDQYLIVDRNHNMTTKIEQYLEDNDKTYFVVVGAGHLIGESSIINLLNQKKKYKIRQL